MEEKIMELERRIAMLESVVNLLSMNVASAKPMVRKPQYKKYVVITDNEECIASIIFSLNYICHLETQDRPNVTYAKVPGHDNFEIVVITREFFYQWKFKHHRYDKVSFEELCDILEKEGAHGAA